MGQILNDTLSQIYENLGDEIKNLKHAARCGKAVFHGRKAK